MKEKNKELDMLIADVITAVPHEIKIGRKTLRIYPLTLAKTFMLQRWIDSLDIDASILQSNPYLECLRLAETHTEAVAQILAIHTAPNTGKDLHDTSQRAMRRNLLLQVKRDHLAGLLMYVLTHDRTEEISDYLGLTDERMRLREVMKVKQRGDKNHMSFGGKSIFGTFIGQLKEMGYTDDEILYERGYSYLRLMLEDKVTSIYLSDEERENLSQEAGGTMLDGDDDASLDALSDMIKHGGTHPS